MIVCDRPHPAHPDRWMLIKQSDHDDHCGRLMSHWTSDVFWQPADRRLLTIAVALHDTGSANWEDSAVLDENGLPWTYWGIPPEEHLNLHRAGVKVASATHPYIGLLVSMHTVGIHRDRLHIDYEASPWHIREDFNATVAQFIHEQALLQCRLMIEAIQQHEMLLTPEQIMNDYRLFEAIDTVSVWMAENMPDGRNMGYVPDHDGRQISVTIQRVDDWAFRITPFPFESDVFECPLVARLMPKSRFRHNDEFREAWYAAKVVTLPYVCVR